MLFCVRLLSNSQLSYSKKLSAFIVRSLQFIQYNNLSILIKFDKNRPQFFINFAIVKKNKSATEEQNILTSLIIFLYFT